MKTNAKSQPKNVITIDVPNGRQRTPLAAPSRFKIQTFENPRTGSKSFRVTGSTRAGVRVRENFSELKAAECRQVELQMEYLARETDTAIRATKLNETELRLAESCFLRLDAPHEISLAVDYWLQHGRAASVKNTVRLDDGFEQFKTWLASLKPGDDDYLRDLSRRNLTTRTNIFVNSVPNLNVSDVTADTVAEYLKGRNVSALTRDNDRRAISRFFSWCMERPRRWTASNPARAEKRKNKGDKAPPQILTVDQCAALLRSAMDYKGGLLGPYVALCLFAGLRPEEAKRLAWSQINLTDNQISLTSDQTKTKRNRTVKIHPTLAAWLKKYQHQPIYGLNWRRDFDAVKSAAGFGGRNTGENKLIPWTVDAMRHTAISHFFRDCGSFGFAAEQFDNSEAIIKAHYKSQAHATSADTKQFYNLTPERVAKGTK